MAQLLWSLAAAQEAGRYWSLISLVGSARILYQWPDMTSFACARSTDSGMTLSLSTAPQSEGNSVFDQVDQVADVAQGGLEHFVTAEFGTELLSKREPSVVPALSRCSVDVVCASSGLPGPATSTSIDHWLRYAVTPDQVPHKQVTRASIDMDCTACTVQVKHNIVRYGVY